MKKAELPNKDINLLIVSYLTNSIDKAGLAHLTRWIDSGNENRRYFNAYKDSWIVSGAGKKPIGTLDKSWNDFRDKISLSSATPENNARKITLTYLRMAAGWLMFFILGSLVTYLITDKLADVPGNPVSIVVPFGSRSHITLPDGSKIWLNAGTTMTYASNYGRKERKILLTGEAYFDVARDKKHPFIVEASGLVVRALATKFNIKAYPDEKTVSATLEEGKIDVWMVGKKSKEILLKPKEKIIYFKDLDELDAYTESREGNSKKATEPILKKKHVNILTHVQTELYTSWKDPRWIIEGEPLGTLAPMLERRYNLRIVFENNELKKYKFSGTIENETVDQLLNAMQLTAPINYSINRDTIRLSINNHFKEEFGKIMTLKLTN